MRGFVKFGNERSKVQAWSRLEILRPRRHSTKDVDKPLAGNVVADRDQPKFRRLDGRCEYIIHVGIPILVDQRGTDIWQPRLPFALLQISHRIWEDHLASATHSTAHPSVSKPSCILSRRLCKCLKAYTCTDLRHGLGSATPRRGVVLIRTSSASAWLRTYASYGDRGVMYAIPFENPGSVEELDTR